MSNGSSGVATSASGDGGGAGGDGRGSGGLNGGGSGMNRSQTDGVESWRRAAEVTQNLKARIEMMKVSAFLLRALRFIRAVVRLRTDRSHRHGRISDGDNESQLRQCLDFTNAAQLGPFLKRRNGFTSNSALARSEISLLIHKRG